MYAIFIYMYMYYIGFNYTISFYIVELTRVCDDVQTLYC